MFRSHGYISIIRYCHYKEKTSESSFSDYWVRWPGFVKERVDIIKLCIIVSKYFSAKIILPTEYKRKYNIERLLDAIKIVRSGKMANAASRVLAFRLLH